MIKRYMFMGYYTDKNMTANDISGISQLSVYAWDDKVFMYFESECENVNPDDIISENLKEFPNGSHWMRMGEIFHFSEPRSQKQWERKIDGKTPYVQIMYLKDDKIGSYVYNHHRYQMKIPGDGDKYGVIFLLGSLMAFYLENPAEIDNEARRGNTGQITLEELYPNWSELMNEHFVPWGNEKKVFWKKIERIL